MSTHKTIPTITLRYLHNGGSGIDVIKDFSNVGETTGCEKPQDIASYFDNLTRLGLIVNAGGFSSLTDKTRYEPLKTHRWVASQATIENANAIGFEKINFEEGFVKLSSYGESFCSICLETKKVVIIKSQESGN